MSVTLSDHIEVKLRNIVVETHCGTHPWEKHPERPNRLSIDITLYAALSHRRLADFGYIDYDHLRHYLRQFPARPHTELIETLLDDVVEQCFNDERVNACRVSIMKLDIYGEVEAAGVEVYRTRAQWT